MVRDMCAEVRMEEGFMRTIIEYSSQDSKKRFKQQLL